jgi:hypothetical protein
MAEVPSPITWIAQACILPCIIARASGKTTRYGLPRPFKPPTLPTNHSIIQKAVVSYMRILYGCLRGINGAHINWSVVGNHRIVKFYALCAETQWDVCNIRRLYLSVWLSNYLFYLPNYHTSFDIILQLRLHLYRSICCGPYSYNTLSPDNVFEDCHLN